MAELVVLTYAVNRALVQPIIDFLQYHEIEAMVQSDDCGGVDPALNFVHGTKVLVWNKDLERAKIFLEDFLVQGQKALQELEDSGTIESESGES